MSNQKLTETTQSEMIDLPDHDHDHKLDPLVAYRQKPWYDYWFYNWITPTMKYANKHKMTLKDVGGVSEFEAAKYHSNQLKEVWEAQDEHKRYTLLRCIWQCYKWPIFLACFAVWSVIFIEVINFHVLEYIMGYINGEYENQMLAFVCCAMIAMIEIVGRGFHMMSDTVQLVAASRVTAAVKGLIYSKIFRVSSATNKKFKKGDLINLLTEDADKINE